MVVHKPDVANYDIRFYFDITLKHKSLTDKEKAVSSQHRCSCPAFFYRKDAHALSKGGKRDDKIVNFEL